MARFQQRADAPRLGQQFRTAGQNIVGDAAIGEYFRVFLSCGVIAPALVMHAWSGVSKKKSEGNMA